MRFVNRFSYLLLSVCIMLILQVTNIKAQNNGSSNSNPSSIEKAIYTSTTSKKYLQLGIRYGSSIPLGSYNDLTHTKGESPNSEPIYSASLDYFWKNIGVGIESGFFSHEYLQAPYTSISTQYNVFWDRDRRDWANFYLGAGPTFSLNSNDFQFQLSAKVGILRTRTPTYESKFTPAQPDLLSIEFPSSTVIASYGSLALIGSFLVSKRITLSLSVGYVKSTGAEFRFHERELIDYNENGWYSLEEMNASPIVEKSMKIVPEILHTGLGINYRFL